MSKASRKVIITGASFFLVIHLFQLVWNGVMFYNYHFTGKLFLVLIPDWVLITEMVLAVFGMTLTISLLKNEIRRSKYIVFEVFVLCISVVILLLTEIEQL
ncbi:hypothetical protein GYB22_04705 [bacterium]|nr:hypothetical protein [bacterium]